MRWPSSRWIKFALLNVLRNRRRGLTTLLIIAVGSAGILIGGGFALYTYKSLREMAARDKGHLILARHGYFDEQEETPLALGLTDYQEKARLLQNDGRVRAVLPRLAFSGLISNGDKSSVFVGGGVDIDEFKVKGPFLRLSAGHGLSSRPAPDGDPRVMIGEGLARIMNARPGDSLTLMSTTVEGSLNALDVVVRGIFSSGVPEIDKRILLTRLETAQSLLLTDKVSTLSVYLYDTGDTRAVAALAKRVLPDLDRQTWLETAYYYLAVRGLYNRIFGLLGIIVLGMVFFAISSSVSMSVMERTREIGTLRAMGTHGGEIVRNFMLEAAVLGTLSVLIGMLIAGATALLVSLAGLQMPPPPARSLGYPLVIYTDPRLYAATAVAVLTLSVAAAWRASRRAARQPIVEALGHV